MGEREAPKEVGHLLICVWHHHHCEDRHRHELPGFLQHAHEGIVILRLLEDRQPRHRSVEHMEHFASRTHSLGSRYPGTLPHPERQKKRPVVSPFPCCESRFRGSLPLFDSGQQFQRPFDYEDQLASVDGARMSVE
jgi:hypothetical protein